uniref:GPI transamidase component family protein / Gaa1-like family protein n=1 Tax=Arundo donax TaxID=35708 RepID=A0A0A8Y8E3_ARUDO
MKTSDKHETQPKPRLIVRLGIFLASHHILFSVICCSAGIIALLFLPSLAKNTYLSENALIPGSANPLFSTEDVIEANRFMKEIEAVSGDSRGGMETAKFIAQQIEHLGAELCYHKFLPHSKHFHPLKFFTSMINDMAIQLNGTGTNFGMNTIGIIRAPRGDGKEAIVLVTPYNSQRVQSSEILSLALGFSVFSLLSRAAWLSKDIVWLSADSQFGEYAAVSAWLNQYHNPVFSSHSVTLDTKMHGANRIYVGHTEKAEFRAFKRAGTMAAALVFKVGETRKYGDRDSVRMYAEASNGQMPNLDLLNVVHYLAVHRQGFRVNIAAFSSFLSSAWLRVIAEIFQTLGSMLRKINPDWKLGVAVPDYVEGTANLASSMYNQALGVPTGSHGAFRDYQVDAVSLEFSPTFHVRNENAKSSFLLRGGRLIEGVVHSVNNLLEKFHQSFFLYFLTAPSKFISVGVYMIPFALLVAPLPIVAAALAAGSKNMEKLADESIDDSKANGGADILQSKGGSWKWLQAAKVLLVIQLWAVLVSLLPYYITQIPEAAPVQNAVIWAVLSIVMLIILYVMLGSPYSAGVEWKLLKATMITSISIGLGLMSIINFATAQLGALILIPMCLFSRPLRAHSGMSFFPRAVLLASNVSLAVLGFPPAALLVVKGLSKGSWTVDVGDFWVWMEFLWEWSSATYLYLFLVHLPCWLLCIHVLLHPCHQAESKVKQE